MQKLNIVAMLTRLMAVLAIALNLSSSTSALDATSTLSQTISQVSSSSAAIDSIATTTNQIINTISSSSANTQELFFLKNIEEVKATFLNTDIKEKSIEELIQIEKNKPKRQIEFIDLKFNDNNKKESIDSLGSKSDKLDKKIKSKSIKEQKLLLKFKNENLDEKQKEKLLNKIEKLQKDIYTNSIKLKLQNLKNARKQVNLNRKNNKVENNRIVNDYLSLQSINTDIKKVDEIIEKTVEKVVEQIKEVILIKEESKSVEIKEDKSIKQINVEPMIKASEI